MVFGAVISSTLPRPTARDPEILARIDGQICGRGKFFHHQSEPPSSSLSIKVASDATQPGCGKPGSLVQITEAGEPVNDLIEWAPGWRANALFLIGPAFARYHGDLKVDSGISPKMQVVPYIEGQACGHQYEIPVLWDDGDWFYYIVVEADEQTPGCGKSGAVVSFVLEIDGQPSIDLGTEPWQAVNTDDWDPFNPPPIIERALIHLCGLIVMTPVGVDPFVVTPTPCG
jgi:hypothetical protein